MKKYKPLFESTEVWSAIRKLLTNISDKTLLGLANFMGIKDFIIMKYDQRLEAVKDKLSGMDDLEIDYLYKRLKERGLI